MPADTSTAAPLPKSKRAKDVYVPNPTTDAVLTFIFLAQVAVLLFSLLSGSVSPPHSPLTPVQSGLALIVACLTVYPVIVVVKIVSRVVGGLMSRTLLAHLGDPLKKQKTMHKFQDQMWQLFVHVSMSAFEYYILFHEDGGVKWWEDYTTLWAPHPSVQENKPSVHLFYLIQLAIWIDTCFSHKFVEERHKDYVMMYVHHIVTIVLVAGSYSFNYLRIGVVVLLVHDLSDVPLDLMKILNYLKCEGTKGFFLVEAAYAGNLVSWVYLRLYHFPRNIIWAVVYGSREVPPPNHGPGGESGSRLSPPSPPVPSPCPQARAPAVSQLASSLGKVGMPLADPGCFSCTIRSCTTTWRLASSTRRCPPTSEWCPTRRSTS